MKLCLVYLSNDFTLLRIMTQMNKAHKGTQNTNKGSYQNDIIFTFSNAIMLLFNKLKYLNASQKKAHTCQSSNRRKMTRDRPLECITENKLILTLVPLQLGKAANCSCLDYFHYNLIPDF